MSRARVPDGMRAYALRRQFGNLRRCPLGIALNERMNTEPGDRLSTSIEKDMLAWSPNPNQRGKLVRRMRPHGAAALFIAFDAPEFVSRVNMQWIGRQIPKADAKWTGQLLARLSREQIRDAFRAAQYTPEEVEAFARAVELRIDELNQLWVGPGAKN